MTAPLRFCLVTTFYPPYHFGGDAIFVHRLAEALAARGHSVDVIHSEDAWRLKHQSEAPAEWPQHPLVRRHPLKTRYPFIAATASHQLGQPVAYGKRLRRLLDDGNYDVIHFHNISLMGGPGVLRFGKALKLYAAHEYWLVCPTHALFTFNREACTERHCLRCTLHSRRPPQLWRYTGLLERCTREVDLFLMPSRFSLDRHRADGLERPMAVLPHFVPVPAEHELADSGPDGSEPYFLYAGRLEKLKGVQDLVELFKTYRQASLWIAGDGDEAQVLREQAKELPHVKFLGKLPAAELGQLYRQAIAVLAPSLCYETFSLSAAEALAHATPVIARKIGALGELVEGSGGGLTFQTLAECETAMERLRCEPELRRSLAARGRQSALENWTAQKHINTYLDMVRGLLAKKAAGGR